MKKIFCVIILLPFAFISTKASTFTAEEVAKHSLVDDCWMIFENKVYDFSSEHLNDHELKFMDISSWCGQDMTEGFKTKAGIGEDHKNFVYLDLENYYIGELSGETAYNSTTNTKDTSSDSGPKTQNPYNVWLPATLAGGAYLVYWALTKWEKTKKYKIFNKNIFNLTFNTILFLGLIPSAVFGAIMVNAYNFEFLRDINFDFLYWHVELSIAFATLLFMHFLTRFKLYKAPLKLLFRKKQTS